MHFAKMIKVDMRTTNICNIKVPYLSSPIHIVDMVPENIHSIVHHLTRKSFMVSFDSTVEQVISEFLMRWGGSDMKNIGYFEKGFEPSEWNLLLVFIV